MKQVKKSTRKGLFETCGAKTDKAMSRGAGYVKKHKTEAIAVASGLAAGILLTVMLGN